MSFHEKNPTVHIQQQKKKKTKKKTKKKNKEHQQQQQQQQQKKNKQKKNRDYHMHSNFSENRLWHSMNTYCLLRWQLAWNVKPFFFICKQKKKKKKKKKKREKKKKKKRIYKIYARIYIIIVLAAAYFAPTEQTHNVATTSLQRRCNVATLQRRCNDVVCLLGRVKKMISVCFPQSLNYITIPAGTWCLDKVVWTSMQCLTLHPR